MFDDENDPKELPIYKKGREIYEVVHQICELIPEDDEMLGHVKSIMLEDPDDDIPFNGFDDFN